MRNTSARAITFLCKTAQNAKDLKELGTTEIHIIRKKRKISVQCFLIKFEVGKKKTIFIMI
jgi:DNA-binding transcriptional regulator YiaG